MVRYATENEIGVFVSNRREFNGSSCRGRIKEGLYVVYSYFTVILRIELESDGVRFWNEKKYSNTTTRLQNIIKRVVDVE